jgi:hypothetical protein
MDLSHSSFHLSANLNRLQGDESKGQLEHNERAAFSRSRRAIEKFDELLHRENAKKAS